MAQILIIDDDDAFRAVLAETLADLGHTALQADSGRAGLDLVRRAPPDAVFLDFKMAGMDGIEVLRRLREAPAGVAVPVVMLTAFANSANTIEAMKLGAFEHLRKPVARSEIERLLPRLLAPRGKPGHPQHEADTLIGDSGEMREVHKLIGRAAATASTVLITGETGTGKELVARLLHESSDRARQPFVAVNCAAIPRDLLESELFGHVKGAFTGAVSDRQGAFQRAAGGTLLLDEIGDMSLDMQAKLLRVLEERVVTRVGASRPEPVGLRVLAATHRDLALLVEEQTFRKDLYFRLDVLPIHIPPLRKRPEDIAPLARHFLGLAAGQAPMELSPGAIERLRAHHWPGNVRELRNAMDRVAALVKSASVEPADLSFLANAGEAPNAAPAAASGDLNAAVEALERSMIHGALAACGGNRAEAARRLGIHRQLLYKKLKHYEIE
jgi:DNA-binding NtrC family response regulator